MVPFSPTPHPWRWRALAAVLILSAVGARLLYLAGDAAPDLAPDEAHYWDWSRNLDWSYYSKGPLVAWLIRASCEAFGTSALAVRLPAVLSGGLILTAVYILSVRVFRSDKFALATVAGLLTIPVLNVGGILMTIDAPFGACWAWALVFGHRAVVSGRSWAWPATGAVVALGILAKYTMVLWLGSAFLFLAVMPAYRHLLFRPGFWVCCASASLGCVPILIWNATNEWVTFAHVGTQAGVSSDPGVRWLGPVHYLAGQAGLLMGFWFVAWMRAMWTARTSSDPGVLFLWWLSLPTFLLFGLFSFATNVQLNWPITAYLSGTLLTSAWIANKIFRFEGTAERATLSPCWLAMTVAVCLAGVVITTLVFDVRPVRPLLAKLAGEPTPDQPLPIRRVDPTCRLRGWHQLAEEIDRCRSRLERVGIEPVIATNRWVIPGELGFYCAGNPAVYTLGSYLGDRHSQYDLWRPNPVADPRSYLGRTFIYVGGDEFSLVRQAFDRVESGTRVAYTEQGKPLAEWDVWICHGFRGLPALPPAIASPPRY